MVVACTGLAIIPLASACVQQTTLVTRAKSLVAFKMNHVMLPMVKAKLCAPMPIPSRVKLPAAMIPLFSKWTLVATRASSMNIYHVNN